MHRRQFEEFGVGEVADRVDVGEGWFAVMMPVLSSTMVSSLCAVSRASVERMRTPAWAPLPVPTMIDSGWPGRGRARAGDDQHRDGGDQGEGQRGQRSGDEPDREGGDRDGDDGGDEVGGGGVGEALDGRLEAWACCTRRMIWASMVSALTLTARPAEIRCR